MAAKYILEGLLKYSPEIYKAIKTGKKVAKTTADYGSKPFKGLGRAYDYVEKSKIGGPLIATGEGVIAGLGAKNVYEGIRDEDYAKAGLGIVEAGLPILQAPRTLMNISKAYTKNRQPSSILDATGKVRPVQKNFLEKSSEGIARFTKPGKYVPEKVAASVALAAPEAVNLFEEAINPPLDVGSGDGKNYENVVAKIDSELNQYASEGLVPTVSRQNEMREEIIKAKNQDKNTNIVALQEEADLDQDEATKFVEEVGSSQNVIDAAKKIDAIKGQGPIPIKGEEVPYTPIDPKKDIKSNFDDGMTNNKNLNAEINKDLNDTDDPNINNYNEPSDLIELFTARRKAYKEYNEALEKQKTKMANRERQSFEQFYQDFRERAGMNVPQQDINYIIMKMGLAMMSAKTYDSGASGFLEILGQAGGQAVEEAYQLYQQERELQQNLVGNFMKYERELDMYYDEQERNLALQQAQLGLQEAEGELDLELKLKELDQKHKQRLLLGDREKVGKNRIYRFEGTKKVIGKDPVTGEPNQEITVPNVFFAKGYQTKTGIDMITYDFVDKDENSETYGQRFSQTLPLNQFRAQKNAMDYTYTFEEQPSSKVMKSQKLKLQYGARTLQALEMAFEPQAAFGGKSLLDVAGTELFLLDKFETIQGSIEGLKSFINGQDANYADTNIIGATTADEVFSKANTDIFLSKYASGGEDGAIKIDVNNDGTISTSKKLFGMTTEEGELEKYNEFIENERKQINEKLADAKDYYNKHKGKLKTESDRLALAKALGAAVFIENQLKYAVANMNKTEDRITVQDILNAQELTKIKDLFASQEVIKQKYVSYKAQIYNTVLQEINEFQRVTGRTRASILEQFGLNKYASNILGESGYLNVNEGLSTEEVLNKIKKNRKQ